jgi:hypothetical protein
MFKNLSVGFILLVTPLNAVGSELSFKFKNPAFSGVGYSNHVFAIEQLEDQRRQRAKEEQEKLRKELESKLEQSNLQKFLKNVEARIYAQISKDVVDKMFDGTGSTSGTVVIGSSSVSFNNDGSNIVLNVVDDKGNTTIITIPLGAF